MDARWTRVTSGAPASGLGQHFLRSRVAAEVARDADLSPQDHVLEIGAGTGNLTHELVKRCGHVVALELDPRLAASLRRRFAEESAVEVVLGDARSCSLPQRPFRVIGNIPFGIATALMRRLLDDESSQLTRADLVVQWEAARKRAAPLPSNVLSLAWGPWWTFDLGRRINSASFRPRPRVDGGVLVVRRRDPALVRSVDRDTYVRFLRTTFHRANEPMPRALETVADRTSARRVLSEAGVAFRSRPGDLAVEDWVRLFTRARARGLV